ncbi:MAG: DMT family transporter [Pyrinomonadaceae bacterium]|nr:DMT family transporter [Pyrinomonadaceae bacterium]MCX7640920.1 DMT family transporter [Pyrinomonadaceae bacterium]MDW8304702.1 DMT family transporter [Acidobacteriota bacterium]
MKTPQPSNTSLVLAHCALFLVQLLFGTLPVIGKPLLQKISAVSLVGIRVGLTALALVLIQRYRSSLKLKEKEDYLKLFLLSFFGVTFNQLFFIGGLSLTTASNTSLLAATIPIFTLLISVALGNEAFQKKSLIGILTAAFGVLLLIDVRNASLSSETTLGDLMIILNSMSYGIYVATSKNVILRNGVIKSMTWIFIFASIFCVPLAFISALKFEFTLTTDTLLSALYIAIFATLLPYLLNAFALQKVNPSSVAVYIYLQPLIGFSAAVVFLREEVTTIKLVSAVLILVGVLIASNPIVKKPASKLK